MYFFYIYIKFSFAIRFVTYSFVKKRENEHPIFYNREIVAVKNENSHLKGNYAFFQFMFFLKGGGGGKKEKKGLEF